MDKLEDKLKSIQNKLGGTKPTPEVIDKLGWHLDYIEELIEGGGSGGDIPEPTVEDAGKVLSVDELGKYTLGEIPAGGGTQLNELDCNYGSSYGDIITIVGAGDFFNFEAPNIDYFRTTNASILKVIHNDKLVKSLSIDNPSGYIEVGSILTITYEDSTTATLTVTQLEYMNDGYLPL